MGSSAHMHTAAPMQPPPAYLDYEGNSMGWRDWKEYPFPRLVEVPPPPLPWIYRDPQRWLLPMLAIVGLIIAAIALNGL